MILIQRSQRGYILVLTLIMLSLAAVALMSIARQSLNRVALSVHAQDELQIKWALISCQYTLAPQIPAIIAQAEEVDEESQNSSLYTSSMYLDSGAEHAPINHVEMTITLGSQVVAMRFSDEQAKLNLNAVLRQGGREKCIGVIEQFNDPGADSLTVLLEPAVIPTFEPTKTTDKQKPKEQPIPIFSTWDQVYIDATPQRLVGDMINSVDRDDSYSQTAPNHDNGHTYPESTMTLWGDGRLHFHRAEDETIRIMLDGILNTSEIDTLLSLRKQNRGLGATRAIGQLKLPKERTDDNNRVVQLLTSESQCYSLWIQVKGHHRNRWQFTVCELPSAKADKDGWNIQSWRW